MGAGITPDPGDPYPRPEAPVFVAADPLFVAEDAPAIPTRPALPVLDDPNRSPNPAVCPFLRRPEGGALVAPVAFAVDGQACVAIGSARGQSLKQQELVCLRASHVDCPRYQRGTLVAAPAPALVTRPRSGPAVPRATLAALLILVLSAGISFGFVVQRGGIAMPVAGTSPAPTTVAAVGSEGPDETDDAVTTDEPAATDEPLEPSASADGGASPVVEPSVEASAEPAPTPDPTAEPTAEPTPEPTLEPTAEPTAKPTATPSSARYKLLKACSDKPDCYVYKVRSGDNLYSIARYFGHSLKTIYTWNPQYPARRLKVGDPIRMPPPTK